MGFKEYEYLNDSFLHEVEKLSDNNFNIYYLIHTFFSITKNGANFYDAWIFNELKSWAVGLRVDGMYLIYANDESDVIISQIHKRITDEVEYLSGFHFTGTKVILDKLFEKANFNYEIYKERCFYTLTEKRENFKTDIQNFIVRKSTINDLSTIAKMNSSFNTEEWNGKNNRSAEEFEPVIRENINEGKFFIIEDNNEIVGFCSTMNYLSKTIDMIGTIYIDTNHRNKKLGTILLSFVVDILLIEANEIYLMTDKQSLPSNKMVQNIGFEKNYEYSDLIFKK